MKRLILATLAVLFAGILPAAAADVYRGSSKDSYAEPAQVDVREYFQGLGVGTHIGGAFTAIELQDSSDESNFKFDGISADGFQGGVHAEYLFSAGRLRFGPYIEGGLANVNTVFEAGPFEAELEQSCYYGGGLKAGVTAFRTSLVFARVGYERQCWEASATSGEDETDSTDVEVGALVIGGGIATMVSDNVSLELTGDYLTPLSIDVDGVDGNEIEDALEGSEQGRVWLRATWRQ
jgi:opacity protein-like surface antigen